MLKTDEVEPVMIQTIPSGCVHLVFHRGENLNIQSKGLQPKNFIRGQFSTYGCLISKGNINMIAVIFHPLGLNPFVRCSMSEIYNRYINVEDLEDIELNHLKLNISAEPVVETCLRLIEIFLIQRLVGVDCNYQRTRNAICQIINQPRIEVNALAENACLGYRQFKRVFTNYVGMSPKEYYRVVRFQRALYLLQNNPEMEFIDLAYSCGFYDPSHLVKDFKEFTGCSPTQYLFSHSPYSTFFSEDCRLNVIKSHSRA
nr:helix-turn-helix domain-containing protein [Parabacteroides sp. ZJ-118]